MWYRIKCRRLSDHRTGWTTYQSANCPEHALFAFSPEVRNLLTITEAPWYEARLKEKDYWRAVWQRAIANMPATSKWRQPKGYPHGYKHHPWVGKPCSGRSTALAMLLGYSYRTEKHNNAGMLISTNIRRGSKPKGARVRKLLKLAGPYGTIFARVALTKMGVAKNFKYWP